jgi:uncharacterized protein (TIGR02598 family)
VQLKASSTSSKHNAPAFSLAEVLFAMAIFVFGVLVLVGTLPNGMASLQTARRQAAEVRVFQHLRAVYQSELDRAIGNDITGILANLSQPSTFYFDDRGNISRLQNGGTNPIAFAAQANLEPASPLPGESDPSPFTRRLRIAVTDRWQDASAFNDPLRHRQRLITLTLSGPVNASPTAPSSSS